MGFKLVFTRQAQKDAIKLESCGLDKKAKELLKILIENPYQNPPPVEKLRGEFQNKLSRRINIQHRIIYEVFRDEKVIKVYRMWTHYK